MMMDNQEVNDMEDEEEESPPTPPPPPLQPQAIVHPLGGLPPEVWEKVLLNHFQKDPGSSFNCYKTCVTWKKILEPSKTDFLFQLVSPILKASNYIPTADILTCRHVSKTWRSGVDQSFEQDLPYLRRDSSVHSGIPPYIWYNDTTGVAFNSAADVRNFSNDFNLHSLSIANPFFHKTVKCISRSRNNDQESNRLFQDFTNLIIFEHGPSIHSCVYVDFGGRSESGRQMEHLFNYLPNLKSLAIVKHGYADVSGETGLEWLISRRNLLPPLPHLNSINIYLDDAPQIAEMLLLSYGTQIQSLHCDFRVISTCAYLRGPVPENSLSNLRDLDIFDAFGSSMFLERLVLFEMPRLERLSLEYVEIGPRRQSLRSLLRIIDKHAESLREIRLPQKLFNWGGEDMPEDRTLEQAEFRKSSKVKLERVKCLGVNSELLDCSVKQWFLQKFPGLSSLCITNYGVHYIPESRLHLELELKLRTFWEWIPCLRRITVERAYLGRIHFYREAMNQDNQD